MSYLVLKDLCKQYSPKSNVILDHMNLTINKGEFIVFLGPSGCGKTTTIRMIAGLEDVTSGDIFLEGKSIVNMKPLERNVSMIFQSYAVWPHMTVYDNIAYPLKIRKIKKSEIDERVKSAAEITQITEYLKRYPAQLSGGQRQRVAVARSIVVKPSIFLMDEPLSNLDAILRVTMRSDLKDIHLELGATTIFVTHDQSEAMSLADRIVVMKDGFIEQVGTPSEVYDDSATKFVASFIGTPPTNFFNVLISDTNGELMATGDSIEFKVPDKYRNVFKEYIGKEVDLGIRPEHMSVGNAKHSHFAKATVSMLEPQGAYTILISKVANTETKMNVGNEISFTRGEELDLLIDANKVMFFDKETTKRIRP